jgi:HKD family nuclease
MTSTFLKRKPRAFFQEKKARVLVKQRNIGGEEIQKDEIVTILRKSTSSEISLDIKSDSGVEIGNVWCEQLELV